MPMATTSSLAAATTTGAVAPSSASTLSAGGSSSGGGSVPLISANAAQFREIHKNTWLKRLTAEGKKITVGPKKSDRSWVVFCVHDDTDAILEGYAEPRQAASHNPEWTVSMQDTLHISHALIPNSHEFEFVVTLANEVIRFHAMSWEIMQEWVETLRSKLREMKILSPRENLYTKLPEIRAPLLPTRDPTSPLPAPPPVPAAIVPGVERVVPSSLVVPDNSIEETRTEIINSAIAVTTSTITQSVSTTTATTTTSSISSNGVDGATVSNNSSPAVTNAATYSGITSSVSTVATSAIPPTALPALASMSNTLTQNLLNMLSDPISAYSEHINDVSCIEDATSSLGDTNDIDFDTKFISPILRKSLRKQENTTTTTFNADNSVRVDVVLRASVDQIKNWESLVDPESITQTRLQTARSLSAGAADTSRKPITKSSAMNNILATANNDNITALEISTDPQCELWQNVSTTSTTNNTNEQLDVDKMNITIIQVSNNDLNEQEHKEKNNTNTSSKRVSGDIFKFPETASLEYKSNVQIIPSTKANNSNTIQVLGTKTNNNLTKIQYATPVKKTLENITATTAENLTTDDLKITTVHVRGNDNAEDSAHIPTTSINTVTNAVSLYGTCYTTTPSTSNSSQPINVSANDGGTPKIMKKMILSANSSGITNITVNNASTSVKSEAYAATVAADTSVKHNVGSLYYEKVFVSTSTPASISPTLIDNALVPKRTTEVITNTPSLANKLINTSTSIPSSPIPLTDAQKQSKLSTATHKVSPSTAAIIVDMPSLLSKSRHKVKQSPLMSRAHPPSNLSPLPDRRRINLLSQASTDMSTPLPTTQKTTAPTIATTTAASTSKTPFPLPSRAQLLTRGLTEAVITTRPSRKDIHLMKSNTGKTDKTVATSSSSSKNSTTVTSNNNGDNGTLTTTNATSSSSHAPQSSRNRNCELLEQQRRRSSSTSDARTGATRGANNNELPGGRNVALRFQHPPQPFRNVENSYLNSGGLSSSVPAPTNTATNSSATIRMTLREHQVMQLRREIMHPGGVRLQLRRKDCVGSIAWVDAFGAIWVAGWKQKEHPVLYNALHIGDQLLSIAGTSVATASEANKIIRNTNTLFVEVLVRRIPFGRGYAIRREREGQCLGLIRDGNTATIVDVVPNSLAARHGLPPKAQSCDGTTLTFWVLTEINGRPLNLYFKDNEIRDRLNSVGRDISILVQPSDLITKLKKQLKSLRGYKDYLVQ